LSEEQVLEIDRVDMGNTPAIPNDLDPFPQSVDHERPFDLGKRKSESVPEVEKQGQQCQGHGSTDE